MVPALSPVHEQEQQSFLSYSYEEEEDEPSDCANNNNHQRRRRELEEEDKQDDTSSNSNTSTSNSSRSRDHNEVERATRRLKNLHPNLQQNLPQLVHTIVQHSSNNNDNNDDDDGDNAQAATAALSQISKHMGLYLGNDCTMALYYMGAHLDITKAMSTHLHSPAFQVEALKFLIKMFQSTLFGDWEYFFFSLLHVGIFERAFEAAQQVHPHQKSVARLTLLLVEEFQTRHGGAQDQLVSLDHFLTDLLDLMKQFPDDADIMLPSCRILSRVLTNSPELARPKLRRIGTLSVLADVIERFNGKNHHLLRLEADRAIISILGGKSMEE